MAENSTRELADRASKEARCVSLFLFVPDGPPDASNSCGKSWGAEHVGSRLHKQEAHEDRPLTRQAIALQKRVHNHTGLGLWCIRRNLDVFERQQSAASFTILFSTTNGALRFEPPCPTVLHDRLVGVCFHCVHQVSSAPRSARACTSARTASSANCLAAGMRSASWRTRRSISVCAVTKSRAMRSRPAAKRLSMVLR